MPGIPIRDRAFVVHSKPAKLLVSLSLRLALGSSAPGGLSEPRRRAREATPVSHSVSSECYADSLCGQSWLSLAQSRAQRLLAPQRPRRRTGLEAVVGARGPEAATRIVGPAIGEGDAAPAAGLVGDWLASIPGSRLENLELGNLTVLHGGGDPGPVVVHRTQSRANKGQLFIPVTALAVGSVLGFTRWSSAGLVLGYFGAQSGLSLYMKLVLSDATVSKELALKGVPAAFLITGVQQVVAFLAMTMFFLASWATAWHCEPKRLTSLRQFATVLCLSLAFAANIGLNNFSLTLVAISMNLVIRSCLPLVTLAMHAVIGVFSPGAFPRVSWSEFGLVVIGVACAGLVTLSELENSKDATESQHLLLGSLVCVISICAGSLDLILGKVLGKEMGLNPLDTTWYMSLPTALALLPPALLVRHPAEWEGAGPITDWEVLKKVLALSPLTLVLVLLSGVFSVSYNVLRYAMVQHLSASHTAFAGNFNKALTIMISLMLGLEPVPDGVWSSVMLLSIAGSISAFMAYSVMTRNSLEKLQKEAPQPAEAALPAAMPKASGGKAVDSEQ